MNNPYNLMSSLSILCTEAATDKNHKYHIECIKYLAKIDHNNRKRIFKDHEIQNTYDKYRKKLSK